MKDQVAIQSSELEVGQWVSVKLTGINFRKKGAVVKVLYIGYRSYGYGGWKRARTFCTEDLETIVEDEDQDIGGLAMMYHYGCIVQK